MLIDHKIAEVVRQYGNKTIAVVLNESKAVLTTGFSWVATENTGLIIEPLLTGVCRSDLKEILGVREAQSQFGHEVVGKVEFVWGDLPFLRGDTVVLNPNIAIKRSSGFANYLFAQGTKEQIVAAFYKIDAAVVLQRLVFVEPLACVVHCLHMVLQQYKQRNLQQQRLLIVGAGVVGALLSLVAYDLAALVTIVNEQKDRLDFLAQTGLFDAMLLQQDFPAASSQNVVVLATAFISIDLFLQALEAVKDNGLVVLYGGTGNDSKLYDLDLDAIRRREQLKQFVHKGKMVNILGSYGATRQAFIQAIDYVKINSSFKLEQLVTKEVALDSLPHELQRLLSSRSFGKVIVNSMGGKVLDER